MENKEYIFIVGTSGVGKSTLAKKLYKYYQSVYIEQHMIPEFYNLGKTEDEKGFNEENTCFQATVALLKAFNNLGYKNIISLDFDDLRCRDLPKIFKGKNFITLKLICDLEQNINQMINRGKGLIDVGGLRKAHEKISTRELLPNEVLINVTNRSEEEVFKLVIKTIESFVPQLDYIYKKPSPKQFYSWVNANKLNN